MTDNHKEQDTVVIGTIRRFLDVDPRHLDAIDEILGTPNLYTTLEALMPLALFTDPVFGMKYPVDEGGQEHDIIAKILRKSMQLWHVAYFAMVALYLSNQYRHGLLSRKKLFRAVNHYNEYDCPLPDPATDEQLFSQMVRMAYQQFPYQHQWWAGMTRASFMYGEANGETGGSLPDMVESLFGIQYHQVLDICMSVYHVIHNQLRTGRNAAFSMNQLAERFLPWIERSSLERIVGCVSQTREEFRLACERTKSGDKALRKYDYNPLLERPLIRIDERYYAPVPPLILLWAMNGIAYQLSEQPCKVGGHDFGHVFGHAFEDFIEAILRKSKRDYLREIDVKTNAGLDRTTDFIIIEGNHALLFDCKTRRATMRHRYGTLDAIERDYGEIVHGLEQCIKTEQWIRLGVPEMQCQRKLEKVTQFDYGVVTLDDYFLSNSTLVEKLIQQKLGRDVKYQVLSGRELELLLANLEGQSLISFIKEKASVRCSLPASYEDYLNVNCRKLVDPSQAAYLAFPAKLKNRIEYFP